MAVLCLSLPMARWDGRQQALSLAHQCQTRLQPPGQRFKGTATTGPASAGSTGTQFRLQDSSPPASSLETRPKMQPSCIHSSLSSTARAQEPSCSSATGTWERFTTSTASEDNLPPARLQGHVTLCFLVNQGHMVCCLVLLAALSCPRLTVGYSWLPHLPTPVLCQRKGGIKLLCLPALSLWHRLLRPSLHILLPSSSNHGRSYQAGCSAFSIYNLQTIPPYTHVPRSQTPRDPHLLPSADITSPTLHLPHSVPAS